MKQDTTKEKKEVVAPRPDTSDLSKEIERSVERQPDESVKTVRVFGDCYRCNWWVHEKHPRQFWLASGKIIKSRFLRATKTNDGLLVEELRNEAKR